ncbi:hypothetical protein ASPSYDRAFT_1176082 [Aspergillus sydowii CBS 593.65]|uniref:Uncharacterized protein n=1 Tax=Aspergillus sydowii CBS 593.65 TaxID=1036612 RepID=A0A1L9SXJ9_9EURO|nr:uncharacterized protein ASPSYDRAFT_1176082 [Aspergillus sydowii CBS 593.65]OJJ51857.1 hypothetical protein ASPSYDRAFT_1176082 [Aspergillus sydowii CBS 593.65]
MQLFHGSRKYTSNVRQANAIINNINKLQPWLEVLDRTDPNTARTIILLSYQTWAKRITCEDIIDHREAIPQTSRPKQPKAKPIFNKDNETLPTQEIQENIEAAITALARIQELDKDNTEPKAKTYKYKSMIVDYFHHVPTDILGYLTLLYKAEWDGQDNNNIAKDS